MSTQCSSDDRWLSKLRGHLAEEGYSPRTSQRCVVVARHFLNFLAKQDIEVGAATPAHVEHYLLQEEQGYRRRHGHLPDYRGWRPVRTSSVHMLLRLVQGQWPPPSVPATPGAACAGFPRSQCLIALAKHVVSLNGLQSVQGENSWRTARLPW
jgi:hypothetical protein